MLRKEPKSGVLYLVGTPIGNLEDLSPRARMILQSVDRIACEDTRHSGQMLSHFGIKARLLSFHQRNQETRIPQLLEIMNNGETLALISDAGLPGISDPGEELVAAAIMAGYQVTCIPGPCALTTALITSGLPTRRFCFEGFLPSKAHPRRVRLKELSKESRTLIFYEAPHRLINLLEDLELIMGDRPLQVARELTKYHEEQIGTTVLEALAHFRTIKPQGECTIILGGAFSNILQYIPWDLNILIQAVNDAKTRNNLSVSEVTRTVARYIKIPRRQLYTLYHCDIFNTLI
uniref:Tetrapyrrole methylase domain-containing protein n=1 Tax=Paulinella micropora TaxID=1928728 RepID=A0A385HZI7_9EUKA|nr:hypothetical protein PMNZ_118 [Paulinella micropora]AXY63077.1 hypothetical protein PMNZ_118 [Paulinella micropora]